MAQTSLRGKICHTNGELPATGSIAPDFKLLNTKLAVKSLSDFSGNKLIYTVPSIDTMVCENTVKALNQMAQDFADTSFIVVSADLPFAQQRFCKQHKIKNIDLLSMMQSKDFATDYGVLLIDGPLCGLAARALFVLDADNKILHQTLVDDISKEPDFSAALNIIK